MSILTDVFGRPAIAQELYDKASALAAAVKAFNDVSWPYMGSDFSMIGAQVDGLAPALQKLCIELTRDRFGTSTYAMAKKPAALPAVALLERAERRCVLTGLPRQDALSILGEFFHELREHAMKLLKLCNQADDLQKAPQPILLAIENVKPRLEAFCAFDSIYRAAGSVRVQLDGLITFAAMMRAPEALRNKLATAAKALSG